MAVTADSPKTETSADRTEIWTVDEVATYLKCSPDLVRIEARKKRLPGFQIGTMWRFRAEAIRALGN